MTTQEVAARYYELACQNNWSEIHEHFHAEDVISREPEHGAPAGIAPVTKGKAAVKAKSDAHRAMIDTIHSRYTSEPLVAGNFFSVVLKRDVTYKGRPRANSEEIAVIEVKDGKIVGETFFY
jgi:hypothetical protein